MEVQRLATSRGNRVNITPDQGRTDGRIQTGAGFFDHLAPRGVRSNQILQLYMATRKQPAIQSSVMNQQDVVPVGAENNAGAGYVSGREHIP